MATQNQQQKDNTIIRVERTPDNPYFMGARQWAQDKRLTFGARGLMAYLYSQAPNWELKVYDLIIDEKRIDFESGAETTRPIAGRDMVYAMINELAYYRYILKPIRVKLSGGRFGWTPYRVFEYPLTANPDTGEPYTDRPYPAKADSKRKEIDLESLENQYVEIQRHIDSLLAADAAPVAVLFNDAIVYALEQKRIPENWIYVGRGKRGVIKKWEYANPYIEGKDGDYQQIFSLYEEYLLSQPKLAALMDSLTGAALVCHDLYEAGVLVNLWTRFVRNGEPYPDQNQKPGRRNLMFEVLSAAYQNTSGGYIGKLENYYSAKTAPNDGQYHQHRLDRAMTSAELIGFVQWRIDQRRAMPQVPETIQRLVYQFRGVYQYDKYCAFGAQCADKWEMETGVKFDLTWFVDMLAIDPADEIPRAYIKIYLEKTKASYHDPYVSLLPLAAAIANNPLKITPDEFKEYLDWIENQAWFTNNGGKYPNWQAIGQYLPKRVERERKGKPPANRPAAQPNPTPADANDDFADRLKQMLGGNKND